MSFIKRKNLLPKKKSKHRFFFSKRKTNVDLYLENLANENMKKKIDSLFFNKTNNTFLNFKYNYDFFFRFLYNIDKDEDKNEFELKGRRHPLYLFSIPEKYDIFKKVASLSQLKLKSKSYSERMLEEKKTFELYFSISKNFPNVNDYLYLFRFFKSVYSKY